MNEANKSQKSTNKGMEYEPLLVAGRSMEEWIAHETRKRKTTFWADEYEIEPVISETILGDGLQLAQVGTIDQRPNYWLIRIDSKTDLSSDEFDIEELLEILEDEFGRHPDCLVDKEEFEQYKRDKTEGYNCLEDYDTFEEYESACQYPAVWWGGGHWGTVVNFGNVSEPCH